MRKNVVKIKKHNFGSIQPGSLVSVEWIIYTDLSVDIKKEYKTIDLENKYELSEYKLSKHHYNLLIKQIEKSKGLDIKVETYDGVSWDFICYNNDEEENWKIKYAYIYGIKPLEKVEKTLGKLEHFEKLSNESQTLFITLLAKAKMSEKNIFKKDSKAEEIVFDVKHKTKKIKQSKWLSMYISLRSMIIDELTELYLEKYKNSTVIHLGCGLDSRYLRIKQKFNNWYDVDYKNVIKVRQKYYKESDNYKMIGSSVADCNWLDVIDNKDNVVVVAEGLTMYLSSDEIKELLTKLNQRFGNVHLIFDAYSKRGVRASKIKNPVNKVGAKIKYGFNKVDEFLSLNENLKYQKTHLIRRKENNLKGITKFIFNNLYCGKISQSIYKIYEFELDKKED